MLFDLLDQAISEAPPYNPNRRANSGARSRISRSSSARRRSCKRLIRRKITRALPKFTGKALHSVGTDPPAITQIAQIQSSDYFFHQIICNK